MSTINVETLCEPIRPESPCGSDLRNDVRFDSSYQLLKNLREEAMALERGSRSAVEDDVPATSGLLHTKWKAVVTAAIAIIHEESKDIEVCALLIEGLVRTAGLSGLSSGLELAGNLISQHWEEVHPRLDPDDPDSLEDRVAPFNGLDGAGQPGTLARYIPQLYVTDSGENDFRSYQFEQAFRTRGGSPVDGESRSSRGFELADIERAAQKTDISFYADALNDLSACETWLANLDEAFTNRCGLNAPSSGMVREALSKLAGNLRYLAGDRLKVAIDSDPDTGASPDPQNAGDLTRRSTGNKQTRGPGDPLQSRADAIAQLSKVARFFRETEPHSPLSYSLENLVRWAGMPLDKLIDEWIDDDTARERYRLMTGMGPNKTEASDE